MKAIGRRCPEGYEYVESHWSEGHYIHSYCRKLRGFRAWRERKKDERIEREHDERMNDIQDLFGGGGV